jgi:thioredoxin-related protein
MKTLLPVLLTVLAFAAYAEPPTPSDDLRTTLTAASKEKKMAFVLMGRPSCGNCNATKAMIKDGKINVTAAEFVMAYLLIDDPKVEAEFTRKFRKAEFGDTLPFVVVADSSGKALATTTGGKSAADWNKMNAEAKKKTTAQPPGAPGTAADPNWPFKTPAKAQ